MALQLSYTDDADHTDASAYHKIANLQCDYVNESASFSVCIYKDQTARQSNKRPVTAKMYTVVNPAFDNNFGFENLDLEDMNQVKAAYVYLKTLPEYAGAIDV